MNFIVESLFAANKYFNDQEPWNKKKDLVRLNTIVYTTFEIVRKICFLMYPIIPSTSLNALKIFNINEKEIITNKLYKKYKSRLDHELKIIISMKYASYFLIVSDYIIWAKKRNIPVFHIEAGNRSFDQRVPEETNRKIVDHLSDINLHLNEHARKY